MTHQNCGSRRSAWSISASWTANLQPDQSSFAQPTVGWCGPRAGGRKVTDKGHEVPGRGCVREDDPAEIAGGFFGLLDELEREEEPTCPLCGRPIRVGEPHRVRQDGKPEHLECPDASNGQRT